MAEFLQFAFSGLTVGAVYALVALGFTIIYNASDVVNFAQGEFVMIGGMVTVFAYAAGVPLPLAALVAILVAVAVGMTLNKLAIEPARGASRKARPTLAKASPSPETKGRDKVEHSIPTASSGSAARAPPSPSQIS